MSNVVHENSEVFRECLSSAIASRSSQVAAKSSRKRNKRRSNTHTTAVPSHDEDLGDASELADFAQYLSEEIFGSLPKDLQELTYHKVQVDIELLEKYNEDITSEELENIISLLPATVTDSLTSYAIVSPPQSDAISFLSPVLVSYTAAVIAPPPPWISTRTSACEICDREHLPLTYHHLIPRAVHAKVMKRGWHEEHVLNSVAWLCRACHSFVHRVASNEELAREYYTVEKICARSDVQKWAQWIGTIRWKKR